MATYGQFKTDKELHEVTDHWNEEATIARCRPALAQPEITVFWHEKESNMMLAENLTTNELDNLQGYKRKLEFRSSGNLDVSNESSLDALHRMVEETILMSCYSEEHLQERSKHIKAGIAFCLSLRASVQVKPDWERVTRFKYAPRIQAIKGYMLGDVLDRTKSLPDYWVNQNVWWSFEWIEEGMNVKVPTSVYERCQKAKELNIPFNGLLICEQHVVKPVVDVTVKKHHISFPSMDKMIALSFTPLLLLALPLAPLALFADPICVMTLPIEGNAQACIPVIMGAWYEKEGHSRCK